jgi:hypothetical protein
MTASFTRVHQICIHCGRDFCAIESRGGTVPILCRECWDATRFRDRIEAVAVETTRVEITRRVRGLP